MCHLSSIINETSVIDLEFPGSQYSLPKYCVSLFSAPLHSHENLAERWSQLLRWCCRLPRWWDWSFFSEGTVIRVRKELDMCWAAWQELHWRHCLSTSHVSQAGRRGHCIANEKLFDSCQIDKAERRQPNDRRKSKTQVHGGNYWGNMHGDIFLCGSASMLIYS